jgi:putative ABC transport system permease protein
MRIRGVPFEVIGLFEPKGVLADGSDEDNQVLIPIRTALRRVFNVRWLSAVFVGVRDPQRMETAETEIGRLLRVRHRLSRDGSPDDFAIQNTTRFLAIQKQTADSLMLLTTGLAALALLVGGIGILALMLLSVKERTGEIGLRMAVGAKPRDILIQFLFEATLLALGGWLAGITIGAIGAVAVAFSTTWTIGVPGEAVLASLAMAVTTGLGFGALPARKASLVPPIEALLAV